MRLISHLSRRKAWLSFSSAQQNLYYTICCDFVLQFVCFGGSPKRMEKFAYFMVGQLGEKLPAGMELCDISHGSDRYVLYKVGPVLSISVSRTAAISIAKVLSLISMSIVLSLISIAIVFSLIAIAFTLFNLVKMFYIFLFYHIFCQYNLNHLTLLTLQPIMSRANIVIHFLYLYIFCTAHILI